MTKNSSKLKRDYESEWNMTKEQSLDYINERIRKYAVEFFDIDVAVGFGDVSSVEFNGYEVGAYFYIIRETKGLIPNRVKNMKAEAMKVYAELKLDQQGLPQETYIGFISGFCDVASKYL